MMDLTISIEMCGKQVQVGKITGETNETACFSYCEGYLSSDKSRPVSISLPLQEEPFTPGETRGFFEALLPEGFTRKTVAGWLRVDEGDYMSILKITDTFTQEVNVPEYKKLTKKQLRELAREGTQSSAKYITGSRISLAGASGKTGLYYDEAGDKLYMPFGDAPSTHIVKQSHVRLSSIVTNEMLCMKTASLLGLDTAESFILDLGGGNDEDVLFATKRFDRSFTENSNEISGLPVPCRLHQEDFGQALKVPSEYKYETGNSSYLKKMFDLVRGYCANPIEDTLKLWDMVVFNYLIGNTDAHVKNFGIIYNNDLTKIRLAPAYDVLSTVIYEESTRDMAFSIGGKYDIRSIQREDFENEAVKCGIGPSMALRRYDELCSGFEAALKKAAESLKKEGFDRAVEISRDILKKRKSSITG